MNQYFLQQIVNISEKQWNSPSPLKYSTLICKFHLFLIYFLQQILKSVLLTVKPALKDHLYYTKTCAIYSQTCLKDHLYYKQNTCAIYNQSWLQRPPVLQKPVSVHMENNNQ
jgi:hypothetical protein